MATLAEAPSHDATEGWPMARLTQRQTCRDHRPFATAQAAWAHYVGQLIANTTDPGQEVYACRACGLWHHGGTQVRSLGRLLAEAGWEDGDANA